MASGCNVGARWHWDAQAACAGSDDDDEPVDTATEAGNGFSGCAAGRPISLLKVCVHLIISTTTIAIKRTH